MGTGVLQSNLRFVQMEFGHWDRAHALLDQAIRAGELGFPVARLSAMPVKGELLLRQGRLDEAKQVLHHILPVKSKVNCRTSACCCPRWPESAWHREKSSRR